MVRRLAEPALRQAFAHYPVVTLTGPRQSGKTTLCTQAFPDHPYANLEFGDVREFAVEDPRGFLAQFPDGAVLDEIQNAPDLVSYIQGIVDEDGRDGLFVLTGSQQLAVSETVSQSLAGRTGLLTLLPLTIAEVDAFGEEPATDELLHRGFYPRGYDRDIPASQLLGDYVETYVERDVRKISQIRDLTLFRRFVKLCAGRVGQFVNYQNLAGDAGVSHTTAREWISVLEATYIVFLVPPLHANISKRLIKSPKLYFHDVGLAAHLLGIDAQSQVLAHPLRGPLFENLVMGELLKHRLNGGRRGDLHFYRDSTGLEVDAVSSLGADLLGVEVKAGATLASGHLETLRKITEVLPTRFAHRVLVNDGDRTYDRESITIAKIRDLANLLRDIDPA